MERHDEMIGADVHVRIAERPDAGIEIAVIGDVDDEVGRLARTNGLDGLMPPRVELSVSRRCRIGACEVSMPPPVPAASCIPRSPC